MKSRVAGTLLAAVVAVCAAGCAAPARLPGVPAVEADETAPGVPLATFVSATGVDVAPDGTIYVTDAGLDALVVLSPDGTRRVEGGPGTGEGQFDAPADVDAGTGLVITVADPGNRRVQRFSREFRYLGSVPVDAADFGNDAQVGREAPGSGAGAIGFGRPVSVATSDEDDLFVVDVSAEVVLKWDDALRPERVIGAFGSGDGQLFAPVAVATDGDRNLYVADAGGDAIAAFDLFGAFVRRFSMPGGETPVGVAVTKGGMLVVPTATRIYGMDTAGIAFALAPDAPVPLVDVAAHAESLYVLTATALYRIALPAVE